jgi:acetyltransferase-like isoleucine patch superfamily enzyme
LTKGRHTYGEPAVATYPGDKASVRIGSFTSIAADVILMDAGHHRVDWITTFPIRAIFEMPGAYEDGHPRSGGDITIGNDVWIGRGARILSGVTIGDGAVIGGYAVVAKPVRPYAIVVGNPAREIRRRFTDEQVEALQRIAWWDWSDEKIRAGVGLLCSDGVDAFIAVHDRGAAT